MPLALVQPSFSVVVPLYRTARYLPDLLASFDRQRPGDYTLQFVFVDDGSDDDSADIADRWLVSAGAAGEVIHQENAGVSAARNRGIDAATGDWVTFPDSDDFLSDEYFYRAAQAVAANGDDVVLLSANVHRFTESTGRKTDEHPLRHKFVGGPSKHNPVDLAVRPTFIQTQSASAFFRLDVIREHSVRFIEGLRVAEDALFASTYLLAAPSPLIVPLKDSKYYYRRRAAANSAADSYRTNPDFYFGRFERGYIPLLSRFSASEPVPEWLQNIILYDLSWLFPRELNVERKATHLSDDERKRVIELLKTICRALEWPTIINYRITNISPEVRALMLTLGDKPLPPGGAVRLSKNVPGSFEMAYLFQGAQHPAERVDSHGKQIQPLTTKTRCLDYFGQDELHERILRLPNLPSITLSLNGEPQILTYGNYYFGSGEARALHANRPAKTGGTATPVWKQVAIRGAAEVVCWTKAPVGKSGVTRKANALRGTRFRQFVRNLAQTPHYKKKYSDAWLIMDKLRAANDNGEYLYDYLTNERPDINAWFVLKRGNPEWDRLKGLGFRLIAYRSLEHLVALQCASIVASSQLDLEMERPVPANFYPRSRRPWRFVYLQHGVLQHNLAHWFNNKDIDLLTTASVDEHASIVDGCAYKLTSDSVTLTGFPRHDVVVKEAAGHPFAERSIILVAPTWRNNLFLPKAAFGAQRKLRAPFLETEFGQNWMKFLSHPAFERLAAEQNAEIVYLPHPNLRGNADEVTYPDHVRVIESAPNVHELMSRSRVTVTDYSSIFFDAALAQSRIVFFQFDQDEFLGGAHTYMPGYWDYAKHGFGPVTTGVDDAVTQTVRAFTGTEADWPEQYGERIRRTLPLTDGHAAQRITEQIERKLLS